MAESQIINTALLWISTMEDQTINAAFYFSIGALGLLFLLLELRLNNRHRSSLVCQKQLAEQLRQQVIDTASVGSGVRDLINRYFLVDAEGVIRKNKHGFFQLIAPVNSILPLLPTSPYRFTPALLTSIGVLGTFLGISKGLAKFNLKGAGTQELMGAATNLLVGMKTAFYTSLAGMTAAVLFIIVLFLCAKIRERRQRLVQKSINDYCAEISPISVLMNISPDSNEHLTRRQLEMAEAVIASSKSTDSMIRTMQQFLGEVNADKLSGALSDAVRDSVKSEIAPALQVLPQALQELNEIKQENGEKLVAAVAHAMRNDVMAPVLSGLKLLMAEIKSSHQVNQDLVAELRTLTSELGNTTETLNAFQNDTLSKLTDFADSLKTILDQFKTDTDGVLKNIAQEINHALNAAVQGMESQRTAFENSAETAGKAFDKQNDVLEKIGREAAALMSDANKTLQSGLGDIDGKIQDVSFVVQQELESFRTEYQKNLTSFFDKQENMLDETLGRQRDGLAGVVADYRKAFEEENRLKVGQYTAIKEQYELLQKGVGFVQQLVEAVGLNKAASFDQLQDIARSIGSQVSLLRKEYGQAAQKFSDMTEQLPKAMDSYYRRAELSHSEFFESFDAAAAKVHSRLAEAAGLLVTAMQTIEMHKQSLIEAEIG